MTTLSNMWMIQFRYIPWMNRYTSNILPWISLFYIQCKYIPATMTDTWANHFRYTSKVSERYFKYIFKVFHGCLHPEIGCRYTPDTVYEWYYSLCKAAQLYFKYIF